MNQPFLLGARLKIQPESLPGLWEADTPKPPQVLILGVILPILIQAVFRFYYLS